MFEFFVYLVTVAITPGPNTISSMANAAEKGFKGVDEYYWKTVGRKKIYFKILSVAPRGLKKSLKKVLGNK